MPFFYWYPLSWYPSRYPLKATQNRTAHRTTQQKQAFFSTQANGTQGSTQRKHPFLFHAALHAATAYIFLLAEIEL